MKKLLFTLFCASLPASPARAVPADPAAGLRVIDAARDRMHAEYGVGAALMRGLDDRGAAIEVHQVLKEMSRLEYRMEGGSLRPIVVFNALIAGAPQRYAAALLARHAAEVRLAAWPDCAEKDYFLRSFAARAWLEIGGQPAKLPLFDGVRDEALAVRLKGWKAGGLEAFVKAESAKGRPTLASLISERRKRFDAAVCESEERGLLKEIGELETFQAEAERYSRGE